MAGAGRAQAMPPAGTTPQQMTADGVPAAYPSTYPSTQSVPVPRDESAPLSLDRRSDRRWRRRGSSAVATGTRCPASPHAVPDGQQRAAAGKRQRSYGDPGPLYTPYGSPDAMTAARPLEPGSNVERWLVDDEPWTWQVLPTGLMYKSYLAGGREPRFGTQFVHERSQGWLWDTTLGARVGLLRYGTENDFWPEGWQLDVEGAAFPRLSSNTTAT